MEEPEKGKGFGPPEHGGKTAQVTSCQTSIFMAPDFISAEAMGTELPRRYPVCKNCKECQFLRDSLSVKANTEKSYPANCDWMRIE
jgi:hypothetical protein